MRAAVGAVVLALLGIGAWWALQPAGPAPVLEHGMNSDGEAVAVLSGLGPGRFRVSFSTEMAAGRSHEREVELDGRDDVELELDLR